MADHGEVEYATATGNDYAEHDATFHGFMKFVEVGIFTIAAILVGLALIGVKDAIGLGVVIIVAASIAAVVGLVSGSGWKQARAWCQRRWVRRWISASSQSHQREMECGVGSAGCGVADAVLSFEF